MSRRGNRHDNAIPENYFLLLNRQSDIPWVTAPRNYPSTNDVTHLSLARIRRVVRVPVQECHIPFLSHPF